MVSQEPITKSHSGLSKYNCTVLLNSMYQFGEAVLYECIPKTKTCNASSNQFPKTQTK